MPTSWRKALRVILQRAGAYGVQVLIVAGVELLVALPIWLGLFRSHPLGFPMALTLVGLPGWFMALVLSFQPSRGGAVRAGFMLSPLTMVPLQGLFLTRGDRAADAKPTRISRSERIGCVTVLFLGSTLVLLLAFGLRLRADFALGKTWKDIFPEMP
jgi:hypothetical protein